MAIAEDRYTAKVRCPLCGGPILPEPLPAPAGRKPPREEAILVAEIVGGTGRQEDATQRWRRQREESRRKGLILSVSIGAGLFIAATIVALLARTQDADEQILVDDESSSTLMVKQEEPTHWPQVGVDAAADGPSESFPWLESRADDLEKDQKIRRFTN